MDCARISVVRVVDSTDMSWVKDISGHSCRCSPNSNIDEDAPALLATCNVQVVPSRSRTNALYAFCFGNDWRVVRNSSNTEGIGSIQYTFKLNFAYSSRSCPSFAPTCTTVSTCRRKPFSDHRLRRTLLNLRFAQ